MENRYRAQLSLMAATALSLAVSGDAHADVSYAYDDLGRVTSMQYDDGRMVAYTYDAAGNRTQHVVSQGPNRPPLAFDDALAVDDSGNYAGGVDPRTNDRDPDFNAMTVTGKTNGTKGTVTIGGGGTSVNYTFTANPPNVGQQTSDTFTYTISDGNGGTATANVSVTIANNDSGGGGDPECGGPGQPICP
jgi:YD repeat-containing protein